MINLLRLIPLPYKALGALFLLAALGAFLWSVRTNIYNAGYNACTGLYKEKLQAREDAARSRIITLENEYEKIIKENQSIGTEDGVGGAVTHAIDSLQNR